VPAAKPPPDMRQHPWRRTAAGCGLAIAFAGTIAYALSGSPDAEPRPASAAAQVVSDASAPATAADADRRALNRLQHELAGLGLCICPPTNAMYADTHLALVRLAGLLGVGLPPGLAFDVRSGNKLLAVARARIAALERVRKSALIPARPGSLVLFYQQPAERAAYTFALKRMLRHPTATAFTSSAAPNPTFIIYPSTGTCRAFDVMQRFRGERTSAYGSAIACRDATGAWRLEEPP